MEDADDNDEAKGYKKLFGELFQDYIPGFQVPIRHLVRDVQ